jgi:predicted exporter
VLLGLVTVAAIAGIRLVPFDSSLDVMLPENEQVQRIVGFLRNTQFAAKVIVSFERADEKLPLRDFLAAVDRFTASLDSPLVSRVLSDFSGPDLMEDFAFFSHRLPQLLDDADLKAIDRQLTPEAVDRSLRAKYMLLLKPQGSFMAGTVRSDPLDLNRLLLERLQTLTASFGYRVELQDGRLVSRDGKHTLVILDTPVMMTDTLGCRRLIDFLNRRLDALPPSVKADIIAGHVHTVSNEHVIKRDIRLTFTIASVVFLLLFLLYFRDIAAVLIFLIPAIAVVTSLNVSAMILGTLSSLVIGLGAVIAGISVDYGIHVYTAVTHNRDAGRAVAGIAKPVSLGALTTIGVFLAFFFAHTEGHRQLACFSIVSILIALAYALFILPQCIRAGRRPAPPPEAPADAPASRRRHVWTAVVFGVVFAAAVLSALHVAFESDVTLLDGTESRYTRAEQAFQNVWGTGQARQAMLVVSATNYDHAASMNSATYREAGGRIGDTNVTSLARIWPSRDIRQANAGRWTAFWKEGREENLRRLLREKGKQYAFAENAFEPFFRNLYAGAHPSGEPTDNALFDRLRSQFVRQTDDGWRFISYFPDEEDYVRAMNAVARRHAGTFVASKRELANTISGFVSKDILSISLVALVLVVAVTFLFLRDIRMASVALAPALSGVACMLGVIAALGVPLNIANLVAGIVVIGLCIDYGIFMTYAQRYRLTSGTRTAVTLSAITTLAGAGVLLFALHPALFSIGLTLVVGVFSGYVTAMLVVPSLYALVLE